MLDPLPNRGGTVTDPALPPAMAEVRDLTDAEYDQTYAGGTGGHDLPADVLAELAEEVRP